MIKSIVVAILLCCSPVCAQTGGGQTASSVSAWTPDTLKEYYDNMLRMRDKVADGDSKLAEERDKRYEQRFQAQEAASTYTRSIQNEFRGSLNDITATKVPRTEFTTALNTIATQLESQAKINAASFTDIQHRLDINQGSSQGSGSAWGILGGVIGLVTGAVAVIWAIITTRRAV